MVATPPLPTLPEGLLEQLLEAPAVRPERIAEVCRRLASGERPGADEVAAAVVRDARALLDVGA